MKKFEDMDCAIFMPLEKVEGEEKKWKVAVGLTVK